MTDDSNTDTDETNIGLDSHQPAENDKIGFDTYTSALAELLSHPNTETPQTVSVEGRWGSGKSSFMSQLENKIQEKDLSTVYFNPWKYQDKGDLWSSFMQEYLRQLRNQQHTTHIKRWRQEAKLLKLRASGGGFNFYKTILISITILIFSAVSIMSLYLIFDPYLNRVLQASLISRQILLGGTSIIIVISAGISILSQLKTNIFKPIASSVEIETPNYSAEQSFLSEVNEDFSRVTQAYSDSRRVFVFIDDLDRCEVEQTTELVKYINLIKEGRSNLVFVIGMDRNTVAAAINAKYEEILPYLNDINYENKRKKERKDTTESFQSSSTGADKYYSSFGHEFLDKFTTLPFQVPQPKASKAADLIIGDSISDSTDLNDKSSNLNVSALSQPYQDIEKLVDVVISALNNNPRKIKKFHSLYQLQVVLANDQSILYDPNSPEIYKKEQVTTGQIAKYVAISIKWPLFTSNVRYDTHIIQEIEQYEMGDADWGTMSAEAKYWYRDSELVRLLLYKVDEEKEGTTRYKLTSDSIANMVEISPRQEREPTEKVRTSQKGGPEGSAPVEEIKIPDTKKICHKLFGFDLADKRVARVYDVLSKNKNVYLKMSEISKSSNMEFEAVESVLDSLLNQDVVLDELEDAKSSDIIQLETASPTSYTLNHSQEVVELIDTLSNTRNSSNFRNRIRILAVFLLRPHTVLRKDQIQSAVNLDEELVSHQLIQLRRLGILSKSIDTDTQSGYRLDRTNQDTTYLIRSYRT